ncbi:5-hydroxyisourate hydrolase-like isoform X2 [Protopterus annectens]|uniref:5-hydroxyisourate hydrolase-like isoform X2 n=1 Tax=Protopterus annectens TaxID=7888 RepID=UPI001CF96866|nr:5-hydroxyisourate hydrolase-like isoform X2 [Protopterus annectens]
MISGIANGFWNSQRMADGTSSRLTTHVLNTALGIPASNLALTVSRLEVVGNKEHWEQLTGRCTNSDGRCPGLLTNDHFIDATYKVRFETGDYWKEQGITSFYPYVEVVFTIKDPSQKYHIPLLLSPFSYTTYRGSNQKNRKKHDRRLRGRRASRMPKGLENPLLANSPQNFFSVKTIKPNLLCTRLFLNAMFLYGNSSCCVIFETLPLIC